jgi:hypothetical protein
LACAVLATRPNALRTVASVVRAILRRVGLLDILAKALLQEQAEAFARLVFGDDANIRDVRAEDTELPAQSLRMDKLLRTELATETCWAHVEIAAVAEADLGWRLYRYSSRGDEGPRRGRIRSLLVCLKPGTNQGRPSGIYEEIVDGVTVVTFRYDVLCMWEQRADDILVHASPLLLALIPFAGDATEAHVVAAMHALRSLGPSSTPAELQMILATFASEVFPGVPWVATISREVRMRSIGNSVYDAIHADAQRSAVAKQLRVRVPAVAERYVVRLPEAPAAVLDELLVAIAGVRDDDELIARLDALLT